MPDDSESVAGPLPALPGSGEVRNLDPFPSVVEALEHVPPRRDNGSVSEEAATMSIDDEPSTMSADEERELRDALRVAAVAVGGIPWQHNRDQAVAAVATFLRELAALPDVPTEQMLDLADMVDEVRDQPDWWPETSNAE